MADAYSTVHTSFIRINSHINGNCYLIPSSIHTVRDYVYSDTVLFESVVRCNNSSMESFGSIPIG